MSADASVEFEWADGLHRFRLPIGQLRELQDKTGVGPKALLRRLMDGTWRIDDLRETIRLGLIGGGMEPLKALSLVKRYVDDRPFLESEDPAKAILTVALVGAPEDEVGNPVPEEAEASKTTGSASPAFTSPEPSSGSRPTS